MATKANYSHTTLADAAGGKKFPTWEVTKGFIVACGAEGAEIGWWYDRWTAARAQVDHERSRQRQRPTDPGSHPSGLNGRWVPRPELVATFEELTAELNRLRILAGNPPLRLMRQDLVNRVWGANCAASTLSDIFNGKRRPSLDVLRALVASLVVMALGTRAGKGVTSWRDEVQWVEAWSRAEHHRTSPPTDTAMNNRAQAPTGVDPGPAGTKRRPLAAARIISGIREDVAEEVLQALPSDIATIVLTTVIEVQAKKTAG
ncbi:helix-turn-helix domain-containing protein [Nocardia testacea]|uniref:helix-turn-helix domain-containing protein n=1 Tax=Nocardia testacea TaxID=248551 RepID=UPI0033C7E670